MTESSLLQQTAFGQGGAPTIVPLGSCHVSMALQSADRAGLVRIVNNNNMAHNTKEIIQLIKYYDDHSIIPPELVNLCLLSPDCLPVGGLKISEVAAIEICNPYPIVYNGTILNRNIIASTIVKDVQDLGEGPAFSAYHWFYTGLAKRNEAVRLETSAKILEYMPSSGDKTDLYREIIRHATVMELTPDEMRHDMVMVQDLLNCPLIGMTHTMRYFPDGRPVSWPGWLYTEVNRLFMDMGVPVVNPAELVSQHGAEFSLENNLFYYTSDFVAMLGNLLAELAIKMCAK